MWGVQVAWLHRNRAFQVGSCWESGGGGSIGQQLRFSMLGLGDIAVPGMFCALLAKWDAVLT